MNALAQNDDRLQIGQLSIDYSICGNEDMALSVQHRLDRLLEKTLYEKLSGLFDPLRAAGDGLWFIRCLELTADIDLELSDRDIMANWSYRFAQALQSHLLDGLSDNVIYFSNYTQYLAQFIIDLAQGSAWQAWYYRHFSSLRALPTNMAIVTALLQQPQLGIEALLGLPRADRARVLNTLSSIGAQRLLNGFAKAAKPKAIEKTTIVQTLSMVLAQQTAAPLLVTDQPWHEALELYLRTATHKPDIAGPELAALSLATVSLSRHSITLSGSAYQNITNALLSNNPAGLFQQLSPNQVENLQSVITLSNHDKCYLLNAIQPKVQQPQESTNIDEPRFTRFGGVFLLLGILQDLPLGDCLENWPDPKIGDKQAAIRSLLLAQCMGANQANRAFQDPLIRDLAGIPPGLTAIEINHWLNQLSSSQILAAQCQYIQWRLSRSSNSQVTDNTQVTVNQCPFDHRRLAVAKESNRNYWLFLRGYQPKYLNRLISSLEAVLPDNISGHNIAQCLTIGQPQVSLQPDLSYLQLPKNLQPQNPARWLLTVIAQGLLNDFAQRLPGFANSSFLHLYNNFLAFSAKLQAEPKRWVVHLGRPPLNVVLSMTGIARQHYQLNWLNNQRIELYGGYDE